MSEHLPPLSGKSYPRKPLAERFWSFVLPEPNSGCWLWTGNDGAGGYGVICYGKNMLATHVSLALAGRPKPSPTSVACHHCDVTLCVNPDHLYWGTMKQNTADMFRRGRGNKAKGEASGKARLTAELVRYIRSSPKTQAALAEELGVHKATVEAVLYGKTWRHVT